MQKVNTSELCVYQKRLILRLAVLNDLSDHARKLKGMLYDLSHSVNEISQTVREVREQQNQEDMERKQVQILNSISEFPYKARYEQILEQRMDDTCTWLLNDPLFRQWRQSTTADTLLLRGISKLCTFPLIVTAASAPRPLYLRFRYFLAT